MERTQRGYSPWSARSADIRHEVLPTTQRGRRKQYSSDGPHSVRVLKQHRAGDPWREVLVPAFSSPEDIARWLADKPRDAAVVLAARAVLRVIPLAPSLPIETPLRAFRCAQAAWAVAAYPGQAATLRPAAQAAASRVDDPSAAFKLERAMELASAVAGAASDENALRFASLPPAS
jgi:hypothetical protein